MAYIQHIQQEQQAASLGPGFLFPGSHAGEEDFHETKKGFIKIKILILLMVSAVLVFIFLFI